ncbi:MAG: hypothetical protein KAG66_12750, partial [Methylococcales bacterium]|nr:hypothetical protein [Methylococcales bacterium]
GADITLSWDGVTADTMSEREVATSYVVLTNGAKTANRSATIIPPYFGSPNGRISFTDSGAAGAGNSYTVCAYNAAGIESATCTSLNVPTTVEMSTSTSQSNPSNNNVFIITLLILSLAVGCFRMVAKRVKS